MIDFHTHFNSDDQGLIEEYVRIYAENDMCACLSGGLKYGSHDYVRNEDVLEIVKRYPSRLYALAKIDLWDKPVDVDELYRYAEKGVVGFKFIYPYYEYDHDMYMPVYEAAEKIGLPVLFHTGAFRPSDADTVSRRPMLRNMEPITLDRIARSFQKLNIVMAHLGTSFFRTQAAELVKLHHNLYCDLAGNGSWQLLSAEEIYDYLKPAYPATGDEKHFKKLIFGSDSYITHPEIITGAKNNYTLKLKRLGISAETVEAIMGGTVAGWIGSKM